MFQNPDDSTLRALLQPGKTIAIVGLSPNTDRPSFRVAEGMQKLGYRIVPVRPLIEEVLGEKAYARLEDIPFAIDIVDVFRNASEVGPIVASALAIHAPSLWLQEGVVNVEAATRAQQAGLTVVMDRCIWREALRLL